MILSGNLQASSTATGIFDATVVTSQCFCDFIDFTIAPGSFNLSTVPIVITADNALGGEFQMFATLTLDGLAFGDILSLPSSADLIVTEVPEPTGTGLMVAGLGGLVWLRRRGRGKPRP